MRSRPSEARPGVALAFVGRPAPEVLELGALALQAGEVLGRLGVGDLELALELVDLLEQLGRRDVDLVDSFLGSGSVGHGRLSLICRFGWSGVQVVDELVHQAGHEADRSDRVGVGHPGRSEDTDDADGPAGPTVGGEHERYLAHLGRRVLVADEDVDPAAPGDEPDELTEVGPVLEGREDPPELLALGELGLRPSR